MTPLGHASVSYLAGKTNNHIWIPGVIIGGILPDIDFIFLFHPAFNQIHRLFTHNLLFVLFTSVLIGFCFPQKTRKWMIISCFIGGILHLLADACLDSNPSNGTGIPFFWPFNDTYFSPINLAQTMTDSKGWQEPLRMIQTSFYSIIWELPFYLLVILMKHRNSKQSHEIKSCTGR